MTLLPWKTSERTIIYLENNIQYEINFTLLTIKTRKGIIAIAMMDETTPIERVHNIAKMTTNIVTQKGKAINEGAEFGLRCVDKVWGWRLFGGQLSRRS